MKDGIVLKNGCIYSYVSSGFRNNFHNTCALLLQSNAYNPTSTQQKPTANERNFLFIFEALHIYKRGSNWKSSVLCYVYVFFMYK